jgi:hypothetical protein
MSLPLTEKTRRPATRRIWTCGGLADLLDQDIATTFRHCAPDLRRRTSYPAYPTVPSLSVL